MELILADTAIWADHFRAPDFKLIDLVMGGEILTHPYVIGELALGHLPRRSITLAWLVNLPRVEPVAEGSLYEAVERLGLKGSGLGFVDAHLLAAVAARPGIKLWTRDKRLAARAEALAAHYTPT